MQINIYSGLIWLTTLLIGSLGLLIYFAGKKLSSRILALNIAFIVLWSIAVSLLPLLQSLPLENLVLKFTFYLGGIISVAFFYFCMVFPEDTRPKRIILWILIIIEILFLPLYFNTDLIIGMSFRIPGPWGWGQLYGPLWFLFDSFFLLFWASGVIILYKKYRKMNEGAMRTNLKFIIISLILGFIPPTIFSIILPRLGYFELNWFGPVTGSFWVFVVAYSITKHNLFNIKVIAIELVTFCLWIFLLIRTLLATTLREALIEATSLTISVILGVVLIRSILHEIRQRELVEKLTSELREAYAQIKNINEQIGRGSSGEAK